MSRTSSLRTIWNRRSETWHSHVNSSPGFELVRAAVIDAAEVTKYDKVVDLGAGTGFLALAFAPLAEEVLAVDISEQMLRVLMERAVATSQPVRRLARDLERFDLERESVDVVVSSYALHHLSDASKQALVKRAHQWLKPGGRLVIADMMFGRGRTAQDRQIIREKVVALMRKGPAGAWRLLKNVVRFGFRRGTELPVSPERWVQMLEAAGFEAVHYHSIIGEAGIVSGRVADVPLPDVKKRR